MSDYEESKIWFRMLGAINIIFMIVFIISAFLPIYHWEPPYWILIFGGWEGFVFIVLSTIFAFFTKKNGAIISGVIGCFLIGFNIICGLLFFSASIIKKNT